MAGSDHSAWYRSITFNYILIMVKNNCEQWWRMIKNNKFCDFNESTSCPPTSRCSLGDPKLIDKVLELDSQWVRGPGIPVTRCFCLWEHWVQPWVCPVIFESRFELMGGVVWFDMLNRGVARATLVQLGSGEAKVPVRWKAKGGE